MTLVTYGGKPVTLSVDEVENILKAAGAYAQTVFQKKVEIRENMIKPAKTYQDLLNVLDAMEQAKQELIG